MSVLPIEDRSNTFVEHNFPINNFVVMIGKQLNDSLCRVLGDGMQYQWNENANRTIVPDASIVSNTRDRKNVSLTGIPRMVMEVLSDFTEKYDRGEKCKLEQHIFICIKALRKKTRKICSLLCFRI